MVDKIKEALGESTFKEELENLLQDFEKAKTRNNILQGIIVFLVCLIVFVWWFPSPPIETF